MTFVPHALVGAALLVIGLGCTTKPDPLMDPEPTQPNAFRTFLMERIPHVLDATMCQCCNKSLTLCYQETLSGARPSCPDT